MKFNSVICTSREQSEQLLALGLKKETTDCIWCEVRTLTKDNPIQWYLLAEYINKHDEKHIPAWSLHRLVEMLPQEVIIVNTVYELSIDNHLCIEYISEKSSNPIRYFWKGNIFDRIICCIEWLIKEGYFNKEYLN